MNPEIEVELVLYLDGAEVSTRRERVQSTNLGVQHDFWAVVEGDIEAFQNIIRTRKDAEEPPF
jgi:hypothetical protein